MISEVNPRKPMSNRLSLQFDETTHIKSMSQLVAFVRFVKRNVFVDEIIFLPRDDGENYSKERL